ncbi:MAG: hypothetical protein ACLPPV_22585 [Candidatus Korobacteraceae bacterium]|jgi:asparagine N-glycosylation enzyme membrane subunit Stt3
MNRKRKDKQQEDQSQMAFIIAAIVACLAVAVVEDILYFATGVPFWSTGFHPVSIFAGSAVFLGLLYFLQRMHDRRHALQYLEPYFPLLVATGANVVLKLNTVWLLPIALACVFWSVAQMRKIRAQDGMTRRRPSAAK